MTKRVFFVGTDTSVGKTTLLECLLAQACARGLRWLPFKPVQSGASPSDPTSDAARLARAANLADPAEICPLWFAAPIAPGLAAPPSPSPTSALADVEQALQRAIAHHRPELVLLEGAGGLLVPMPGDSWQPDWIAALADRIVVVARAGLGTINHTLLTIDALRRRDLVPCGIFLCEVEPPDPSNARNAEVVARASQVPVLATLPHGAAEVPELVDPLLAVL